MDIKRVGTFLLFGGFFVIFIVGYSIPFWLNYSDVAHVGLWQFCTKVTSPSFNCYSLSLSGNIPDYWNATRAMETIGLIAAAVGLCLCGIGSFIRPGSSIIRMLAGLAAFASAGCIIIGVIVFAAKKDTLFKIYDFHAGFGLAIVSAIGLAFSGILCFVIKGASDESGGTGYGNIFGGGNTPGAVINK